MDVFKDKRFSGIVNDPRFKKIPSKHVKTKVDKRFHSLFKDERFELQYKFDKRGSPLDHKIIEDYKKFYQLDDDDDEEDTAENDSQDKDSVAVNEKKEKCSNESKATNADISSDCTATQKHLLDVIESVDVDEESEKEPHDEHSEKDAHDEDSEKSEKEDDNLEANLIKNKKPQSIIDLFDRASDDSTSTDTDTTDSEPDEELDHNWQELDAHAPRSSNISHRLAVCNMDWDRIHAEDLFIVFNSFKPAEGTIRSIKIYPSEFGMERMEKEKLHGPAELIEEKLNSDEESSNDISNKSKASIFHRERLRQYQINRLKYFFAVADCDSDKTADALYDHLNGLEFESSGCIMDLRFIPNDMTFEQEAVSVASSISDPSEYKPLYFTTSALNQIKVDITWDENDPRRKEVLEKAFTDPESMEKDLKEYLASPSESEDDDEAEDTSKMPKLSCKEAIEKYKALLQSVEEKEKKKQDDEEFDMEITWEPGLKEKTEQLVKEKAKEILTPFEEKLQKKKEVKKQKRENRKSCKEEDADDDDDDDDNMNSSDDFEQNDEGEERKSGKKNKLKRSKDKEDAEKKLAELALLVADSDEKNTSDSDDCSKGRKKGKRRKIKRKNKEKKEKDSFVGDINDPRFAAMYSSHLFHMGPSDLNFQGKKGVRAFVEAVQKKKQNEMTSANCEPAQVPKTKLGFGQYPKEKSESVRLKEKLSPFCKDFQKKKGTKKQNKPVKKPMQKEWQHTVTTETSFDISSENNNSKKLKRKQKAKNQGFSVVDLDEPNPSISSVFVKNSSSSNVYPSEEADVLIFSSSAAKIQQGNSVRKRAKFCHKT